MSLFTAISKTSQARVSITRVACLKFLFKRISSIFYTEVLGEKHTENEFKEKKSNKFFAARRNLKAQREKEESCTSKRRQKRGNYFEIVFQLRKFSTNSAVGSITSRCSGKEPALLPELLGEGRPDTRERRKSSLTQLKLNKTQ